MPDLKAGINAGGSGVISAMRAATVAAGKNMLKTHIPSQVFRDEVGVMTTKGFGEDVLIESMAPVRIAPNAARFLTDEAWENSSTTKHKTYNPSSNSPSRGTPSPSGISRTSKR